MRLPAALACLLLPALLAAQKHPHKPTPREKAIELLESASATVSIIPRTQQSEMLWQLGSAWQWVDKKKAVEAWRQSFAASGMLTDQERWSNRNGVISSLATVDFGVALELFRALSGAERSYMVDNLVRTLLAKGDANRAIALVQEANTGITYPYGAVSQLLASLTDLNARNGWFSEALAAYERNTDAGFQHLVIRHWRAVSPPLARRAIDALLKTALAITDDPKVASVKTMTNSSGSATFHSRQDEALFELLPLLEEFDPAQAADLLSTRTELNAALAVFPEGMNSFAKGSGGSISSTIGATANADNRSYLDTNARVQRALADHNYNAAIEIAQSASDPSDRASLLISIGDGIPEDPPERAESILSKVMTAVKDVPDAGQRVGSWISVARNAHRFHDDALCHEALDRAIADTAIVARKDEDRDHGNDAPRTQWPSTVFLLQIMNASAEFFGIEAETLLDQFRSADVNTQARIYLAATLLGHPNGSWGTATMYR